MSGKNYPDIGIAEIERNAREVVRVTLGSFEGTPTVSLWRWYRSPSGDLRPGRGGLVLGLRHLPALADALSRALSTAHATGRLPAD